MNIEQVNASARRANRAPGGQSERADPRGSGNGKVSWSSCVDARRGSRTSWPRLSAARRCSIFLPFGSFAKCFVDGPLSMGRHLWPELPRRQSRHQAGIARSRIRLPTTSSLALPTGLLLPDAAPTCGRCSRTIRAMPIMAAWLH